MFVYEIQPLTSIHIYDKSWKGFTGYELDRSSYPHLCGTVRPHTRFYESIQEEIRSKGYITTFRGFRYKELSIEGTQLEIELLAFFIKDESK